MRASTRYLRVVAGALAGLTALSASASLEGCGGKEVGGSGGANDVGHVGADGGALSDAPVGADASTGDVSHVFPDAGAAEASATGFDATQVACSSPLAGGATPPTLASIDVSEYCIGVAGLDTWSPCDGLAKISTFGVDCASVWIYDRDTGLLEWQAETCDGATVCSSAAGFSLPSQCGPESAAWGTPTDLCASPDASISPPPG